MGKPYFVGADVAKALGYKDTVNALKQHCRGVVKHHLTDSLGRNQEAIRDLVSSVVIAHLGGKESNAYKEIGKKVFAECNRDIKTYFAVNARNNIPKLRFEESMEYVRNWHPCTNTVMMIRDCNAQMSIS